MSQELTQNELDEIEEFQKYQFDTQLLLEGEGLDDLEIRDYISEHFEGNELLVVGDDELIKLHFHTNEPWQVLAYCATLGDIYDVVIENMFRQAQGLQG
jgi:dihydroxyacetone kinase-like predicted kinase